MTSFDGCFTIASFPQYLFFPHAVPREESKVVKSYSLIKILHHFLDKKEGANNNQHEGKRSHRQVQWPGRQWPQVWLERAGDNISAKRGKAEFSTAAMLHSIGNNKFLPGSRHMLDPGDAQARKRDLAPGPLSLVNYTKMTESIHYPSSMMCKSPEQ